MSETLATKLPSSLPTNSGSGSSGAKLDAEPAVSLCETLDRVLNKGVVAKGEITISVAGVDLLYVGLGALVSSVDSARGFVRTDPLPTRAREDE